MLKCDWEKCVVVRGDTRKNLPWNIGQFGSNTSTTMARTNYVAAMDALQKMKEIAAKDLGGKPEDFDIDGNRIFAKSAPGRGMTYAKVAQRAIELGGKYSGKELPADINPMTRASATALSGGGLIGVAKDNLPVGGETAAFAVAFVEIELDIETGQHRMPAFLTKNSLGQLPVLELDDGTTLTESVAICRYFEEMIPEPPLFGRSAMERALVEMWNRRMEIELLLPTIDVFIHTHPFWAGKRQQLPDWGEHQRKHLSERMRWLDGELKDRQHIGIDRYNIADITAQVALLTARGACKMPIPEDHKNLARWWADVTKRPSARA